MQQLSTASSPAPRRGRWSEAAARFEAFMSELSRCAPNHDSRFDPVYSSLFSIRDLIRRQADREAMS